MAIDYTEHALVRMRHRAIARGDIEDTIRDPEISSVARPGRLVALRKYGDKFLKVIYEKSNDKITVVTVYWTRRMQRPW